MAKKHQNQLKAQGIGTATCLHVDEIAFKKGHSDFETVIYTETEILETMSGKKSLDLQAVLKAIPGIGRITRVCMDMCVSFADAVRQAIPTAEIVLDRFHIIKKCRRYATIRYILFRDYRELKRDERRLLKEYLGFSQELKEIYWLTQDFRKILTLGTSASRADVSNLLGIWCHRARIHFKSFVKSIKSWWDEVINACLFPLNNGRAEGVNNKIKLVKRQGFGFRNRENFKLRIQAACNP